MRTKASRKPLKTKKKITKAAETEPRLRHSNEQETDFDHAPDEEGRMANLTSVRHGSGYHRPGNMHNDHGPDDGVAA